MCVRTSERAVKRAARNAILLNEDEGGGKSAP